MGLLPTRTHLSWDVSSNPLETGRPCSLGTDGNSIYRRTHKKLTPLQLHVMIILRTFEEVEEHLFRTLKNALSLIL